MLTPIGKSRAGEVWSDYRNWPHLLVAGWTGSGKSNYLHCLLSFLSHQKNVKLFIIDLKRMEFECYSAHASVAYTTAKALRVLSYLRHELTRRMELLAKARVNHIKRYKGKLDYFVLVVDEFSQLSPDLTSNKDEKDMRKVCHQYLIDIICLARSVGIHVVIATQRPDKDILPGQLKANIPAVICFRVKNHTNSEICLDNGKAAWLPADIPGRAIWQFNVEREVQTYFMGDDPSIFLPPVPTTKPDLIEEEPALEPC